MDGGFHELLIYAPDLQALAISLPPSLTYDFLEHHTGERNFIELKSALPFSDHILDIIATLPEVDFIRYLQPVLPILAPEAVANRGKVRP